MLPVCFPTVNCYDLLQRGIESVLRGTVQPSKIIVVDNGGMLSVYARDWKYPNVEIYRPPENLGVAATWNWFIQHTEGRRIISNDDIEFAPDTIEKMEALLDEGHGLVCANQTLCDFSCFAITDEMVSKIGYFDEDISPKYAYYEDNDYKYRMKLAGQWMVDAKTAIIHGGSITLKRYSPKGQEEHWRKFGIAQGNYVRKWGGLPDRETFKTPFNQ